MLQPKSLTRFLCWIPLIKFTSLKNSSTHCLVLKNNLFTATVFPSGRVPLNTEPAPPWPNFLDGLKKSVAFSSVSYLKFKFDLFIFEEIRPRILLSKEMQEKIQTIRGAYTLFFSSLKRATRWNEENVPWSCLHQLWREREDHKMVNETINHGKSLIHMVHQTTN